MARIGFTDRGSEYITVLILELQNPQNTYSGFRVRIDGGQWRNIEVTGSTGDSTGVTTFEGLNPYQRYYIEGEAQIDTGVWYAVTAMDIITRPENFNWTSNVSSGAEFRIRATEWNNFVNRINQFRVFKGLSVYNFTTAYANSSLSAVMFNEARQGIQPLNFSIPSSVNSGDIMYANSFNALTSALNSVT